ncbi:MAG: hypothetical protein LBQ98_09655 [Nitrososphaerota archaeon]|jgi:hypothetical protein|nr:hypothetical protein [Nitrososphaerota archaeon]
MKKKITFAGLLLICIMILSTISLTFGNFATATTGAANFLPNNFQPWADPKNTPPTLPLDTLNEIALSEEIADYITLVFIFQGYNNVEDIRNTNCDPATFKSTIGALSNYDKGVIYSKGHRTAYTHTCGNTHMGLIMHDNETSVADYEIGSLTSSKIKHAFIWHCETGIIPIGPNPDTCGYRGMPKAVTNNTSIAWWGTSGSQVYLGWNNTQVSGSPLPSGSPQYEWTLIGASSASYNYGDVAILYYGFAGSWGYSTADALIQLSYVLYGKSFADTSLAYWLVVYGNMYLGLP